MYDLALSRNGPVDPMISHRHRCIYIKTPKCASTTVRNWFVAHAGGLHSFYPAWCPGPLPYRIQMLARALELYPDYFTFTLLRNPYRRFVSLYLSAIRRAERLAPRIPGYPEHFGSLHEFGQLCGELLADVRGLWGREARAFYDDNADRRYGPLGIRLRHLYFIGTHALPQVDFLPDCNPERLFGVARARPQPLSFIGTVETLDADFRRVQNALDLPPLPLPRHNASASAPAAFEDLRRNAATRRLIEELYADDLALTGCGLDDAPAPSRRSPDAHDSECAPRASAATLIGRGRLAIATFEIDLGERLRRAAPARRVLAPIARLCLVDDN